MQNHVKVFPLDGNSLVVAEQSLVRFEYEDFPVPLIDPVPISKIDTYLALMSKVRTYCSENGLIPVYHYTRVELATLIIKGGFKMSTKGQGDGGVYFSTLGPASYDIGSPHYEDNIIIDSFGREKLEDMRGRHKVDICMVYAMDPLLCDKLDNLNHSTLHVPQEFFKDLSLSHPDGSFFLRMDRLLACFHLNPKVRISGLDERKKAIEIERVQDLEITEQMRLRHTQKLHNEKAIGSLLNEMLPCVHVQWAVTFGGTKFNNVLTELEESYKLKGYKLFYHYGSLCEIEKYVRCGVPVLKPPRENSSAQNSGIMFTLHHPDHLTDEEIQLFGNCEAFLTCLLPTRLLSTLKPLKKKASLMERSNIEKIRSMRRGYSEVTEEEISGLTSDLYYLPLDVVASMRGSFFDRVLDPEPWEEGILLLQPQCIKSAYQIMSEENVAYHLQCKLSSENCVVDTCPFVGVKQVKALVSISDLKSDIEFMKKQCEDKGLAPFYYYTDQASARSILVNGFQVQGHGDATCGVRFLTSDPLSYLHATDFEDHILQDLGQVKEKDVKVEVCLVCGLNPLLLEPVTSKVETKPTESNHYLLSWNMFRDLSMVHQDDFYYLRPDRIVGAMQLKPNREVPNSNNVSPSVHETI